MEGSFRMTPGTLAAPLGEPFQAEVRRWTMALPGYVL